MNQFDRQKASLRSYDRTEMLIMPKRNDAAIFTTVHVHHPQLHAILKEKDLRFFSLVLYACLKTVEHHPIMRRFIIGQKVYDHKKILISTVIKKDKLDENTNHFVKFELIAGMTPHEVQHLMNELIHQTRNNKIHKTDKLMNVLSHLPAFVFSLTITIAAWLDRMDLLPNGIISSDPLHTGLVIANLGSIKGQSVYHHLFNWGTCSCVITVGELTPDGEVDITFSIDERIAEGVAFFKALAYFKSILEDPNAIDD